LEILKCCEILGISPNDSYNTAKTAYRELANIYHPDKHMHNARQASRAAEKFKELLSAWNELEAYYKNPSLYGKVNYENQHKESQQNRKAEAERRAEAEHEAEAEWVRTREELKYKHHRCPNCGEVNKIEKDKSINAMSCKWCMQFFCKETELQLKRLTKYKFIRVLGIYVLFYFGISKILGNWGVLLTIITAPFLVSLTFIWHYGFEGWRTS